MPAKRTSLDMDNLSRQLINHYQGGFPLLHRPFEAIAERFNCDETQVISSIRTLLDSKILSRFGPLYDAACMGGGLSLAAMSVVESEFAQIAAQVNNLPEVAHNYQRDHELNMWFVLATETPAEIHKAIAKIEKNTGLKVYNFPKIHEFYIGLWLKIDESGRVSTRSFPPATKQSMQISDIARQVIQHSQSGLPLVPAPYEDIASKIGCDEESVIKVMQDMQDSGVIRRIGVVPNHYRLGLSSNGMTVWDITDDQVINIGELIGQLDFVSHCYQRPRCLPQWPYNLFAMVHGCNRDEVDDKANQIADILGDACQQHDVLFSSAILKKSGLRLVA